MTILNLMSGKLDDNDLEERDLGVLKKKRDRAESPCSLTTDSETINEDVENGENEPDRAEVTSTPPPCPTSVSPISTVNTSVSTMISCLKYRYF